MEKLSTSLEKNFKFFQQRLNHCKDVEFRILNPYKEKDNEIIFLYCENIVDELMVFETLFENIIQNYPKKNEKIDQSILKDVFQQHQYFFR
ncbi:hypothetical protein [Cytobacillus oceanisediminis]|uniref:hypothetical protein n=1 Tax=Cytobacillus oceanisediminis TaxID=665099 RepID=UPI00373602D7